MRSNPYSSPGTSDVESESAVAKLAHRKRWMIFAIACVVLGLIPIYGHFAHVGRDEQITVLFLMLAWAITCCNIGICLARAMIRRHTHESAFWVCFSFLLIGLAYFGFYGIGNAVMELWV